MIQKKGSTWNLASPFSQLQEMKMVDFFLNEKDQEVIAAIRKRGLAIRKYARQYDDDEKSVPDEFSEAVEFDYISDLMNDRMRHEGACTPWVFSILSTIYRCWGDPFLYLRKPRWSIGNATLAAIGTQVQKQTWGGAMLAMANTEPGCGSDSKAIQTTAVLETNEWVLNGEKIFVTDGVKCEGIVVWATIDPSAGRGGIKAFLVLKGTPGLELVKKEKKMGIRAGDTAAFVLKNCRIPRENLLGQDEGVKKDGGGFKGLMQTFNITRPAVAAVSIGEVLACFEEVESELETVGIRVDWESGPKRQSAVQEKLIALEALLEAAMLTTLRAARLMDRQKPNNLESSIAKAKSGELSRQGAQVAVELLGAMGITHDHMVEKWFRDARIGDIYEGTGEIQRLVIARALLDYTSADLM
jgi:acyl-CoA dehydrogenase